MHFKIVLKVVFKKKEKEKSGAGERAQQLSAFAVVTEDPGWIPRMDKVAQPSCNSSCRGSDGLFWPPRTLFAHGALKYIR